MSAAALAPAILPNLLPLFTDAVIKNVDKPPARHHTQPPRRRRLMTNSTKNGQGGRRKKLVVADGRTPSSLRLDKSLSAMRCLINVFNWWWCFLNLIFKKNPSASHHQPTRRQSRRGSPVWLATRERRAGADTGEKKSARERAREGPRSVRQRHSRARAEEPPHSKCRLAPTDTTR